MKKHTVHFMMVFLLMFNTVVCAKDVDTDVVVIVDTSVSMKEKGMDPRRVSLLVSKLLSDVTPGRLSFVRLLDLNKDANILPSTDTGIKDSCQEVSTSTCTKVKPVGDWLQMAFDKAYGLKERPMRGDISFKKVLENHLEQVANNSPFTLAFSAARGALKKRDLPFKYIIWLSDGEVSNQSVLLDQIDRAKKENIKIEAIVFGAGNISFAKKAGIPVTQTKKPADLMKAFAGIFRKIVHAPYDIDNTVLSNPKFKMLSNMKEAWIVVYGDDTLSGVSLIKPDGSRLQPSYAEDYWSGAGAYKVAFIKNPVQGDWKVIVKGGGSDVAYAVVQNSSLYPYLEKPQQAFLGIKTLLEVSIKTGGNDQVIMGGMPDTQITAEINGQKYQLNDKGKDGDSIKGDGLFGGKVVFSKEGKINVLLALKNLYTNKSKKYNVNVKGSFSYIVTEPLPEINFGNLKNNSKVCKSISLNAKQEGVLPFELKVLASLPPEHQLIASTLSGEEKLLLAPGEVFNVCLKTGKTAPSSEVQKETLLQIKLFGSSEDNQQITYNISWNVKGLSFFQRWLWLILTILALIVIAIIVLGYILPERFQSTLHIALGGDLEELEEFIPMQLKRMPKVKVGFYRNAQAFIHDDFRVIGIEKGASVKIKANKSDVIISAMNGRVMQHKDVYQEWKEISSGYPIRIGEILRVGDTGLYFKLLDK